MTNGLQQLSRVSAASSTVLVDEGTPSPFSTLHPDSDLVPSSLTSLTDGGFNKASPAAQES